jgi:hypothetical protein
MCKGGYLRPLAVLLSALLYYRAWDLESSGWISSLCQLASRDLSQDRSSATESGPDVHRKRFGFRPPGCTTLSVAHHIYRSSRFQCMRFIYALVCLGLGLMMVLRPNWLIAMTGRIVWVEKNVFKLYGGTLMFYRLLGAILVLMSVVIAFGRFKTGNIGQYFTG